MEIDSIEKWLQLEDVFPEYDNIILISTARDGNMWIEESNEEEELIDSDGFEFDSDPDDGNHDLSSLTCRIHLGHLSTKRKRI